MIYDLKNLNLKKKELKILGEGRISLSYLLYISSSSQPFFFGGGGLYDLSPESY
jgi:hypothetical protein